MKWEKKFSSRKKHKASNCLKSKYHKLHVWILITRILDTLDEYRDKNVHEYDFSLQKAIDTVYATLQLTEREKQILNWHYSVIFGGDAGSEATLLSFLSYFKDYKNYEGGDTVIVDGLDVFKK